MARICSGDTAPEIALRRELHGLGLRYRLHNSKLPGRPDLVFSRHRVVVFVHGCFWHRHAGCKIASTPKTNTSFWKTKFELNVARDARVLRELEGLSWRVLVAWECELQSKIKAQSTAAKIAILLRELR